MDVFKLIYTVLGGLGIFFFGMRMMSDALQVAAGDMIRKVINSLTSNRILAVLVGIFVTMLVQSSSVTTVMVVGFVNAGLMKLTQAIGIIFGANIGTTITGWIISIKIGKYGLLLIGLGIFPMLFGKNQKWKNIGSILFGIGMIFFGLQLMSGAFKPLRSMPEFLDAISYFSEPSYGSYLASVFIGCLLTMIIQSSSAMLGITIALAMSGVISFHTGAALVLGENIGTTITALLASVGGNINAKRAARAHATFNLLGVAAIICIFPFYIEFIEWLVPGASDFVNEAGEKPNIAVHIATSHTIFNVCATVLFIPWVKTLAAFVTKITPEKKKEEQHHLVMLGNPKDMLPATALIQATSELNKLAEVVQKMFERTIVHTSNTKPRSSDLIKIKDYETITDNIQKEITVFVCQIMEKSMSSDQTVEAQAIVRIADELESVGDYLVRFAVCRARFEENAALEGDAKKDICDYLGNVKDFYELIAQSIGNWENFDHSLAYRRSQELKNMADDMRSSHLDRSAKGYYKPLTSLTFSDMAVAIRKVRSHIFNIAEANNRLS